MDKSSAWILIFVSLGIHFTLVKNEENYTDSNLKIHNLIDKVILELNETTKNFRITTNLKSDRNVNIPTPTNITLNDILFPSFAKNADDFKEKKMQLHAGKHTCKRKHGANRIKSHKSHKYKTKSNKNHVHTVKLKTKFKLKHTFNRKNGANMKKQRKSHKNITSDENHVHTKKLNSKFKVHEGLPHGLFDFIINSNDSKYMKYFISMLAKQNLTSKELPHKAHCRKCMKKHKGNEINGDILNQLTTSNPRQYEKYKAFKNNNVVHTNNTTKTTTISINKTNINQSEIIPDQNATISPFTNLPGNYITNTNALSSNDFKTETVEKLKDFTIEEHNNTDKTTPSLINVHRRVVGVDNRGDYQTTEVSNQNSFKNDYKKNRDVIQRTNVAKSDIIINLPSTQPEKLTTRRPVTVINVKNMRNIPVARLNVLPTTVNILDSKKSRTQNQYKINSENLMSNTVPLTRMSTVSAPEHMYLYKENVKSGSRKETHRYPNELEPSILKFRSENLNDIQNYRTEDTTEEAENNRQKVNQRKSSTDYVSTKTVGDENRTFDYRAMYLNDLQHTNGIHPSAKRIHISDDRKPKDKEPLNISKTDEDILNGNDQTTTSEIVHSTLKTSSTIITTTEKPPLAETHATILTKPPQVAAREKTSPAGKEVQEKQTKRIEITLPTSIKQLSTPITTPILIELPLSEIVTPEGSDADDKQQDIHTKENQELQTTKQEENTEEFEKHNASISSATELMTVTKVETVVNQERDRAAQEEIEAQQIETPVSVFTEPPSVEVVTKLQMRQAENKVQSFDVDVTEIPTFISTALTSTETSTYILTEPAQRDVAILRIENQKSPILTKQVSSKTPTPMESSSSILKEEIMVKKELREQYAEQEIETEGLETVTAILTESPSTETVTEIEKLQFRDGGQEIDVVGSEDVLEKDTIMHETTVKGAETPAHISTEPTSSEIQVGEEEQEMTLVSNLTVPPATFMTDAKIKMELTQRKEEASIHQQQRKEEQEKETKRNETTLSTPMKQLPTTITTPILIKVPLTETVTTEGLDADDEHQEVHAKGTERYASIVTEIPVHIVAKSTSVTKVEVVNQQLQAARQDTDAEELEKYNTSISSATELMPVLKEEAAVNQELRVEAAQKEIDAQQTETPASLFTEPPSVEVVTEEKVRSLDTKVTEIPTFISITLPTTEYILTEPVLRDVTILRVDNLELSIPTEQVSFEASTPILIESPLSILKEEIIINKEIGQPYVDQETGVDGSEIASTVLTESPLTENVREKEKVRFKGRDQEIETDGAEELRERNSTMHDTAVKETETLARISTEPTSSEIRAGDKEQEMTRVSILTVPSSTFMSNDEKNVRPIQRKEEEEETTQQQEEKKSIQQQQKEEALVQEDDAQATQEEQEEEDINEAYQEVVNQDEELGQEEEELDVRETEIEIITPKVMTNEYEEQLTQEEEQPVEEIIIN